MFDLADELDETQRAANGFGSTGNAAPTGSY
jgi:dUTPase